MAPMTVTALQDGEIKASTKSANLGSYALTLVPGHYVLQVDGQPMGDATVVAGRRLRVDRLARCA